MSPAKFVRALSFATPPRQRVVIFDQTGSDILANAALEGLDYWVFPSRFEAFYIGLPILWRAAVNFFRYIAWMPPFTKTSYRGFFFRIYVLSCMQYARPAAVLTFVENSYAFQWLSRVYKGPRYIAVQNGMRLRDNLTLFLPAAPDPASVISLPDFVCFGEFERDLYSRLGHKIDRFHPVGALRGGYYLSALAVKKEAPPAFDLCLVSEWDHNIMVGGYLPKFRDGLRILESFFKRYATERKLRVSIAGRHQDDGETAEEEAYYRALMPDAVFIHCDRRTMSTYSTIDDSRVSLSICCTASLEALGWGKKTLFCNFTGMENYNHPLPEGCLVSEPDYEVFRAKLDALLARPDPEFRAASAKAAGFRMNYGPVPAHKYIRDMVLQALR